MPKYTKEQRFCDANITLDGEPMMLHEVPEYLKNNDVGHISFNKQVGPIKEYGVNGVQVDDMVEVIKNIIQSLNDKFPCRENAMVITKLDEAQMWLGKRKADREKRNVEGTNNV